MFFWSAPAPEFPDDAAKRLRRIESKLDRILDHLGIRQNDLADDSGLSTTVRALADRGQKINAIKAYREETGAGLKDAKEAVEAYMGR